MTVSFSRRNHFHGVPWSYIECNDKDRKYLKSSQLMHANHSYTNLEAG
jgi:hypothetical protein